MERGKHTKQNIDLLDFFTTHDLLPPLLSRRNKVENSWQPAFGRFWRSMMRLGKWEDLRQLFKV